MVKFGPVFNGFLWFSWLENTSSLLNIILEVSLGFKTAHWAVKVTGKVTQNVNRDWVQKSSLKIDLIQAQNLFSEEVSTMTFLGSKAP